jgi:chemotaxis protein CheD
METQLTRSGLHNLVVDISGIEISDDPSEVVVTYSLGSCLGLIAYDPIVNVGGMVHCMLPMSKIDLDKAKAKPGMFVDTGVPKLLDELFKRGASKKNLVLKAAGCSKLLDNNNLFRIGERNYAVLRKLLWKNDLLLASESIGGTISRTLRLYMSNWDVTVATGGKETAL